MFRLLKYAKPKTRLLNHNRTFNSDILKLRSLIEDKSVEELKKEQVENEYLKRIEENKLHKKLKEAHSLEEEVPDVNFPKQDDFEEVNVFNDGHHSLLPSILEDHQLAVFQKQKHEIIMNENFGKFWKRAPTAVDVKQLYNFMNLSENLNLEPYDNLVSPHLHKFYGVSNQSTLLRSKTTWSFLEPKEETETDKKYRLHRHNFGHLRMPWTDKDGELTQVSYNTSVYPINLIRKTGHLMKTSGQYLNREQLRDLGRRLPSYILRNKTNLNNRPDLPFDFFEYIPRTGRTQAQRKFIKMYDKAWKKANMDDTFSMAMELGLNKEDYKIYKHNKNKIANDLYSKSKAKSHKRMVFDTDMGIAYSYYSQIQMYSKLTRVFNEIRHRDANFQVDTVLDYGCQTGIAYQAISDVWKKPLKSWFYHGVDKNKPLLDLANKFIFPGHIGTHTEDEIRNTNIRNGITLSQQLPKWNKKANPNNQNYIRKYDVVLVADKLWDIDGNEERYKILYKLWMMTGKYLIIIDKGNKEGHLLTQLARAFILSKGRYIQKPKDVFGKSKEFDDGYTYAPCPHDKPCQNKGSCFFKSGSQTRREFTGKTGLNFNDINAEGSDYTYLIMKKGDRFEELFFMNEKMREKYPEFNSDEVTSSDGLHNDISKNLNNALKFKALDRRDTSEIMGELPWPRLLTNKGRALQEFDDEGNKRNNKQFGKLVMNKAPLDKKVIKDAKICLPTGKLFIGEVSNADVSENAFNVLLHSKFGDRLMWFNFNTYMWNYQNMKMLSFERQLIEFDENPELAENRQLQIYDNFDRPKGRFKEFDKNSLPAYWQRLSNTHPLHQMPYFHGEIYRKGDLPLAARHSDRSGGYRTKLQNIDDTPLESDLIVAESIRAEFDRSESPGEKYKWF